MNIMDELKQHDIDTKELGDKLGEDTCKKIGAILNILEIGNESIAHAKIILHTCEDILDKCSITFGIKRGF